MSKSSRVTRLAARQWLVAGALLVTSLSLNAAPSRALEIIPSLGMTKATDPNAADAAFSGGLALRAPILPFLKLEGGISYRQDSYYDQNLKVRQWPVTASAWLTPFPMVYAGGGIGWYRTTYDFREPLLEEDNTTDAIGLHMGGGLTIPLATNMGLDLNGRYVFMQKNNDIKLPTTFNPDYWNASVGLAIRF